MDRVLLPVKRFKQRVSECSIAAASSIANFFDNSIVYSAARKLVPAKIRKQGKGLYTSQQARLLNELGFNSVTIVTADLNLIDFSWAGFTKKSIIRRMKKLRAHYRRLKDEESWDYVNDMIIWLEDERFDNNIVIDYEFKKYITKNLDRGIPVGAAINWTSLFKFKKWARRQKNSTGPGDGDITGIEEDHSVVIRGYDESGVFVVDSHHTFYKGKRAKYKSGFYKLPWDKFLVNIPAGDLVIT